MVTIHTGDCREVLKTLADCSVNCCVTSPPYYGLRDYGHDGQIGLEKTPEAYVAELVTVFEEVRRVLRADGTLWLNLGDSYSRAPEKGGSGTPNGRNVPEMAYGLAQSAKIGSSDGRVGRADRPGTRAASETLKPKDLIGIPWRVAFALQAAGWWLRSEIIWHKPNPMPESVTDRPTKSHEQIFLLAKSERYFYDAAAIMEQQAEVSAARLLRGVSASNKLVNGSPGQTPHTVHQERPNIGRGGKSAFRGQGHFLDGKGPANREGRDMKNIGCARREEATTATLYDKKSTAGRLAMLRQQARENGGEYGNGTRNKRSVWTVSTKPYREAHFATFPTDLITPCILAGCPVGGVVLDPFGGSGTTGEVAEAHGRHSVLIELNPAYVKLSEKRTAQGGLLHVA